MARVYLGLGSNLGDRLDFLARAIALLAAVLDIDTVSDVYESEPVGFLAQPDFLNAAVRGRTLLEPRRLLLEVQSIERALGRDRSFRNAPRSIDIDILLFGRRRVCDAMLEVPHPRLLERGFVLRPLVQLDPDLKHPVTGRRLADHLAEASGLGRAEPVAPAAILLNNARIP